MVTQSYFPAHPTTYQMRTVVSGCKITYFVHQVNTKQYDLTTKSGHEKTIQAVWKVLP